MFMLVDADALSKRPAFDHDRLAAALSLASGQKYTAITLPFSTFEYPADDLAIERIEHLLTIGRLPGTLLLTMQGQAVQSEDYRTFFVVLGLALLAGVVAFIYRDRVETWFKHKKPVPGKGKPAPPRHRNKSKSSSP
jgi:hypothetical protein